jgi:hypothetical protein
MQRRFLLLSPMLVPLTARAQSEEWQTVIAPDLRCRLEMPSPAEKSEAAEKEKGHIAPRLSWESRRGQQIFDFDYADYEAGWFSSHDTKQMVRDLGRGEAEKAFPTSKYKYVRDEAMTLQGWDGYALDIEDASGASVIMRTYIVRDRLYRLLVTADPDMKSRSAALRFVDSFKLAETRQ